MTPKARKTTAIHEAIKGLKDAHVYVIGDIILDTYLTCSVDRMSPEAPVPVAKIAGEKLVLGGAANVAHNISSLGGKAILIGQIGIDREGKIIEKLLLEKKIHGRFVIKHKKLQTISKTRVMSGIHHIVRIDKEEHAPISKLIESKVIFFLKKLPKGSVLIVADYNKGMITETVADVISSLPQTRQIKVLVDPTPSTIQKIKFSYLIKPNRKEAEVFARETIHKDWSNLLSVAETIKKHTEAENVFITLGADGMALLENGKIERFPVFVRNLYDVCGAGDTSIAILGAGLSSGLNLKDSLLLSAVASGLVVERIGTSVCTIEELLDFARHHSL